MRDTFIDGKADFSRIDGQYDLFIGEVKHQSFVEINEEGTEAALATVVKEDKSAGFSFNANKPFIYVIRENKTNRILFIG